MEEIRKCTIINRRKSKEKLLPSYRMILVLLVIFTLIRSSTQISNDSQGNQLFSDGNREDRNGRQFRYEDPKKVIHPEGYDFIIVGSGAAGSVLANRLSEIDDWKVLLLEAGEQAVFLTSFPALAPYFQFTQYNWGYLMEKQANFCLGLTDERMHWPRGRALGGSSIINYMIHVRGNRRDYDRWAKMGNPGWSYREVLPYFMKSEDANIKIQDPGYHSTGGYLNIEDIRYRTESVNAFVRSAQEAGYPYVDYNGKDQMGVSYIQSTTKMALRASAEMSFLKPVKNRPNLTILTKSRVTKLVIDPKSKKATGVIFVKNKKYYKVKAKKEVILSAGAFNSPQLLMLSGIGPREHLENLRIPVMKDLPVGRKMYDHLCFLGLVFKVNESITINQIEAQGAKIVETAADFFLRRTGPLANLGGAEGLIYMKTEVSDDPENYPDMELLFIGSGLHTDGGTVYKKMFRVSDKVYDKIWKPLEGQHAWSVFPMLLHPKSYGYLELKSKNPFHWPKFHGNYLTDPYMIDMKTFLAAIREVQRISKMPSFQKYDSRQIETKIPGCEQHQWDSDQYWECALRHVTATLHHQVATCKMGPRNDPEAVVDNRLRVYGVSNLRVADTSIIPLPLSAHTNSPSFMVGEKASDIIKEDWLQL